MPTHSKILERIALGENQQQDFKFEISDAKKIARSFAAFANTDGGSLLLGVKDNGSIVGVKTDEEVYMAEAAAKMFCRPEAKFSLKEWRVNGKIIVEVIIPKATVRPVKAVAPNGKWLTYVRVNDQNILADKVLIDVWHDMDTGKQVTLNYTETEAVALKFLATHKAITLNVLRSLCDLSRIKAQRLLADFVLLGIIEIEITEKGTIYRYNYNEDND
ncbi:MAG: ATP-binding protein [Bacteroidales bacterium]|nr:ATP-binding protein [Bacteroidales bacterium]